MSDRKFVFDRKDLVGILRDLNLIVVSLDRIGSVYNDLDEDEHNALLADFITDRDVFRKLASMRSVLSEPFSGEPDSDEMEKEMENLEYWSYEDRASSRGMTVG
ncbi:hypothetical protein QUF80_19455 [Desulfococcaceae bacterium HSG8]|nr:hypothetical protein [Desulfococcaceae bacterium HSG8]